MNCLKIEWSRNVLFAASQLGLRRKRNAPFTASREYVTAQVLKELKCSVVCYLQGRICNPTNLLNHVASSRTDDANLSNLILTRKCGNYSDVLPLKAARRDSIVRVGKTSGPVLSRLWTKVHEILQQRRRPFALSNALA